MDSAGWSGSSSGYPLGLAEGKEQEMENLCAWFRQHTLCRWGHHCAPRKRIQKLDGGKLPQLCCYCRRIVDWGRKPARKE